MSKHKNFILWYFSNFGYNQVIDVFLLQKTNELKSMNHNSIKNTTSIKCDKI